MDHQRLSSIAHTDHPVAAPVSEANVERLLRRAACRSGARVLDVGCGEAAWTLRALELYSRSTADAVDVSAAALDRARTAAATRDLAHRVTTHHGDARAFRADATTYDLVLCVGASHAFGGLAPTLTAVADHLAPSGLAIIGEGFWQREPDRAALDGLRAGAEDFLDLAGTVDLVEQAGWSTVYAHVSDDAEWDDYEWSWVGSLTRWALDNPDDPDAARALATAREHRDGWLRGYRGCLGFVCLLLSRCTNTGLVAQLSQASPRGPA